MSDEYTPTTEEVRADYVRDHTRNFDSYSVGRSLTSEQEVYGDRFDRWLAAHDAEVLAAAGVAPQPEPEYEYGNRVALHSGTQIMPAPDRDTAMKFAWLQPAFRRLKAGAWEPVPNQEGQP